MFGNDFSRAPISGQRKVWSPEGIKQPLHLVRRPGHHRLGGHHQSGGQLDDHLIATHHREALGEQVNVYSERRLVVIYTKLCVLQSGLIWALLGELCTLGLGLFLQALKDCIRSGITGNFGLQCNLGVWAIVYSGVFGLLHRLVGNCLSQQSLDSFG